MADDCVFCKIIDGKLPCYKIYEDDNMLAFLDIAPVHKGHCLIIPRQHRVDFPDLPDDLMGHFFTTTKRIAEAVKAAVNADAYNIGMNVGKEAGQIVMHAHLHVIPRYKGDGLKPWGKGKNPEGEEKKVQEKILQKLEL